MEWKPIETYVFFDTETTGLINENGYPAITELCMLAIKRKHLLDSRIDEELRVQYKLLMCFRPYTQMTDTSVVLSGFNEDMLDQEARMHFNRNVFNTINSFINCLQPPVCLIAHKGYIFHFPLIKRYFEPIDLQLSLDVKCTDSLLAFYDLLTENVGVAFAPEQSTRTEVKSFSQLMRDPYHAPNPHPHESYGLKNIYPRIFNDDLDPKRAENQCIMMMKIAQTRAERFVQWVDENHCAFAEVPLVVEGRE